MSAASERRELPRRVAEEGDRVSTVTQRVGTSRPRPPSTHRALASPTSLVLAVAVLVVFAVGAWRRRWMADDGLIVLRTVRNLLAGNGPVFNAGERVESNTSALWTYVVTAVGWIPGSLEMTTVLLCLLLSVAGLGLGMLAAAQLSGGHSLVLPVGALIYVALPPARDFATSGLEVGLVLVWLGGLALLLARRAAQGRTGGEPVIAVVAGLAPLVRPELTLVGGLAGLLLLLAPLSWPRRGAVVAAGAALPLAYQLFRMAYYGLPYPVTAVAKEASESQWGRGWAYVADLVDTYHLLWVLAAVAALVLLFRLAGRRDAPEAAVPADDVTVDHGADRPAVAPWALRRGAVVGLLLASAVLYVLYVARVGGDFMHGRMLLPAVFLVLLPVMVVRVPRALPLPVAVVSGVLVAGATGWSVAMLLSPGPSYGGTVDAAGVVDERGYWTRYTGNLHPITAADYVKGYVPVQGMAPALAELDGAGGLVRLGSDLEGPWLVDRSADPAAPPTVFFLNLGMASMSVGLDVRVLDMVGLSNPVAAHSRPIPGSRVGHEKGIPPDWDGARVGLQPSTTTTLDPSKLAAAQVALGCRLTDEMVDSYTAPLTWSRAVQNVRGAFSRAAYRYPTLPVDAVAECDAS